MTKKEWFYVFITGFIGGALGAAKKFYDFVSNFKTDYKIFGDSVYSGLSYHLIQYFFAGFIIVGYLVWLFVQLRHLFKSNNQIFSGAHVGKKTYLIQEKV